MKVCSVNQLWPSMTQLMYPVHWNLCLWFACAQVSVTRFSYRLLGRPWGARPRRLQIYTSCRLHADSFAAFLSISIAAMLCETAETLPINNTLGSNSEFIFKTQASTNDMHQKPIPHVQLHGVTKNPDRLAWRHELFIDGIEGEPRDERQHVMASLKRIQKRKKKRKVEKA
ncbi:uncharacterized protein ATNIH1004_007286 [Aspergillus tanneri]|uniref:Uncharacterized protein n=1 Tax=Aspergillus tanneri TaxID=1220188 RepID=A0A5M9MFW3_9EURO|nr:uncharacterized protein ATNIH1004_007286 [Aspergillus tanneri]KAA8645865.1 hypothetical protein ATNIH1004_007286 [Aspergillus tanneri]